MTLARRLAVASGVVIAAVAALLVAAPFADGPIGPMPGGALSGELTTGRPPWEAVGDLVTIEIRPERPWSLNAYAIPHDGELYVPSFFAARRRWVAVAMADPRARVRIDGRLDPRRIERVDDPALRAALASALAARHGFDPGGVVAQGTTWFFRLAAPGHEDRAKDEPGLTRSPAGGDSPG